MKIKIKSSADVNEKPFLKEKVILQESKIIN